MAKLSIYVHARENPITFDVPQPMGGRIMAQYDKKIGGEDVQRMFRVPTEGGNHTRFVLDMDQVVFMSLEEEAVAAD